MPNWLKVSLAVVIAAVALAGVAIAVLHAMDATETPDDMLSRNAFRCLAISESFRTVAANRIERKSRQLARIERLLALEKLEPLDEAKLRAELAILSWEVEDSRFMQGCAEAYYKPGSTKLRTEFGEVPSLPDFTKPQKALLETQAAVTPRMLPHGYENRANLYLATAALGQGDTDTAIERAEEYLQRSPDGLYADALKLVIADSHLQEGRHSDALAIYREVGRLKIGLDSHYARYRVGSIARANGDTEVGEQYIADVIKWADRGDRQGLKQFLKGKEPIPPPPAGQ